HLRAGLAEYMVPAAYVRLGALPRTANGKVDRDALPVPDGDAYAHRGYEAPRGATEEVLATLWADALQREKVGRNDNFFELGGHSLLAVTLIERMRQAGLYVDGRAFFASRSLAELADAAARGAVARTTIEAPPNRIQAGAARITPEMLSLVSLRQEAI